MGQRACPYLVLLTVVQLPTTGEPWSRKRRWDVGESGSRLAAFDIRTSGDFQMSDVIPRTVKIAVDRLNLAGLRQNQRKTFDRSPRPRCGDVPSQS